MKRKHMQVAFSPSRPELKERKMDKKKRSFSQGLTQLSSSSIGAPQLPNPKATVTAGCASCDPSCHECYRRCYRRRYCRQRRYRYRHAMTQAAAHHSSSSLTSVAPMAHQTHQPTHLTPPPIRRRLKQRQLITTASTTRLSSGDDGFGREELAGMAWELRVSLHRTCPQNRQHYRQRGGPQSEMLKDSQKF